MKKEEGYWSHFISSKEFWSIFAALVVVNGWHMLLYIKLSEWYANNAIVLIVALILYIVAMSAVLAFFSAIIRTHFFNKPLRQMSIAARKVATGDFSVRIPLPKKNENWENKGPKNYKQALFEDFNTMVAELASIETLKNDFITNVSHEIKTPLSVIKSYASALEKEDLSQEQRKEYLSTIIHASEKLTHLVTQTLKLNKLENQSIVHKSHVYDLCEQLRCCVLSFEDMWEKKAIEMDVNIPDSIMVPYEAWMLELVWNNLLSNAIKFTPTGGKIGIKAQVKYKMVCIRIADNGCGMDTATCSRIFDKFYQGDTSHSQEGNGLGLALVKSVLDRLQGTIQVKSALEKGTVFELSIPLS